MCSSLCTQMLAKYTSLKFNALSTHLLNKEIVYFDKNALIVLQFYNYQPHTFMVVILEMI